MTAAGVVSSTALRIVHRTWIDYWERSPHYPATPHTSSWHIDPRSVRVGGMMMIWSNQLKVLCVDALMQLVCVTRFHEVDACGVWDSREFGLSGRFYNITDYYVLRVWLVGDSHVNCFS
ncbi:hypothetical protein BDEG_23037 [Batrachochytrium dendrobatidis JEL423]|uniref:Uncharacterized protein n=1 Tax=Batrachochytrium dendrobatidis (strain JEL423) TaxID=403673 RepID=A0A177WI33_BATDL|nr:hypothetical protein BDEG_23037 [Batrachochytrium dendrobatidis JEL423]